LLLANTLIFGLSLLFLLQKNSSIPFIYISLNFPILSILYILSCEIISLHSDSKHVFFIPRAAHSHSIQSQNAKGEEKSDDPERDAHVLNPSISSGMNDVLREKVAELHKKFYKGQQTVHQGKQNSNETHVQDLSYCEQESSVKEEWETKEEECCDTGCSDSMEEIVPVRDIPLKKVSWF
jgi:hypothetical protein